MFAKGITVAVGVTNCHDVPGAIVLFVRFIPLNGALTTPGQTFAGPEIPNTGFTFMVIRPIPPQPGSSLQLPSGKLHPEPVSTF